MGGMKNYLKEGDGHGEEQPDVDHLDVRSNRKALGKAEEAKMRIVVFVSSWCIHYSLKLDFRQFEIGHFSEFRAYGHFGHIFAYLGSLRCAFFSGASLSILLGTGPKIQENRDRADNAMELCF